MEQLNDKINEKKQFTQEDLEQILGGSSTSTVETSSSFTQGSSATVAARTGQQTAAVSDNLS